MALLGAAAAAVWFSIVRERAHPMDVELDVLLDAGDDEDDEDLDAAWPVFDPAPVLAMGQEQIDQICKRLFDATPWSVHPALQRKPQPRRRDHFFTDGENNS